MMIRQILQRINRYSDLLAPAYESHNINKKNNMKSIDYADLLYNTALALGFLFYRNVFYLGGITIRFYRSSLYIKGTGWSRFSIGICIHFIFGSSVSTFRSRGNVQLGDLFWWFSYWFLDAVGCLVIMNMVRVVERWKRRSLLSWCRCNGLSTFNEFNDFVSFSTQIASRAEWIVPTTFCTVKRKWNNY